jgi:lysophospholipase-2
VATTTRQNQGGLQGVQQSTPMLMCHGTSDDVVTHDWGKKGFDGVHSLGKENMEWKSYEYLWHTFAPYELDDVFDWIVRVLYK